MTLRKLDDLLIDNIKDMYHAEKQLTRALPKMAKAAQSPQLKQAFERHLNVTHSQIERLEKVFQELGRKPVAKTCRGMKGLIEETNELLGEDADPDVLDAGLIASSQKVEHYEISAYGTARTFAEHLGYHKAAQILQSILDEEKKTDVELTTLAEQNINPKAER